MRRNSISLGILLVIVFATVAFVTSHSFAQVGGGHLCRYCHPTWPNVCDSVSCPNVNEKSETYCGCLGTHGTNEGGQPWALAQCGYGSDCVY